MPRKRPGRSALSLYVGRRSLERGLFGEDRFWRFAYRVRARRRIARRVTGRRDRVWRGVYGFVYVWRFLRSALARPPELIAVEKLSPGQFLRVEAVDPATMSPEERKHWRTP